MPGLPCDGDGVCMVCRGANPPEVVLLRCSTCATPWHSPCLSKPPALADAASWRCPDCSPDSSPAPAPSGPGNDLVTAVRAIEAEETLSDQEKAPRRQALFAGSASAAADEDDDTADDALEIVGKNFSCVFTVSGPQGASDGCATLATKDMARKIGTIPYSVNQFIRIVSCFDDERKTRIKELGFESMLGLKPVKMRKNLLNCLIDLYDPVEESVTFGSGESFTVYPYDVDVIMGLKDEGTLVLLDENISPDVIPKEYKDSLATVKKDRSNEWPSGNLALLQYTYWEKVCPWESYFFFSGRTTPLHKYWDEDVAYKRDMYDISYGRSHGLVVDDLMKVPTIDQLVHCQTKQKDMITPISMVSNNTEEVIHLSKRLTNVENLLSAFMKKDNIGRCLQEEFNKAAETTTSESMEGRDGNELSGMTQSTME